MSPPRSSACSACRLGCSERGVLGWGGLNTTKPLKTVKVLLDAGGPQQVSEAAADNLVFMSKYLNADEDEGENMLPKAQPGQRNLVTVSVVVKLPRQVTNAAAFVDLRPKNKCKRGAAVKGRLSPKMNPDC